MAETGPEADWQLRATELTEAAIHASDTRGRDRPEAVIDEANQILQRGTSSRLSTTNARKALTTQHERLNRYHLHNQRAAIDARIQMRNGRGLSIEKIDAKCVRWIPD